MIDFNRKKRGRKTTPRPPGLLLPELGIKTVPALVPPRMRHGDEPNPSWFREFIIDIEFADRVPETKWALLDTGRVISWSGESDNHEDAAKPRKNENIGAFIWRLSGQVVPEGMTIDHIHRDIYDNRLASLRPLSERAQCMNQRAKGAVLRKYVSERLKPRCPSEIARPYSVRMPDKRLGGKLKEVGRFATEHEAVEVRNSLLESMLPDDVYALVMPSILAEPPLDEEGS